MRLAGLALGALRSPRFIFRNRRNRAPLETVVDRPPIRISHILVHNGRQGFLNCAICAASNGAARAFPLVGSL
jgi:hypothetical protein